MKETIISGGMLPPALTPEKRATPAGGEKNEFGAVLRNALDEIHQLQQNADKAIANVQLESTQSVHEAMIALEKASLSFKAMMQVRNRILEAYQEVMRMQV